MQGSVFSVPSNMFDRAKTGLYDYALNGHVLDDVVNAPLEFLNDVQPDVAAISACTFFMMTNPRPEKRFSMPVRHMAEPRSLIRVSMCSITSVTQNRKAVVHQHEGGQVSLDLRAFVEQLPEFLLKSYRWLRVDVSRALKERAVLPAKNVLLDACPVVGLPVASSASSSSSQAIVPFVAGPGGVNEGRGVTGSIAPLSLFFNMTSTSGRTSIDRAALPRGIDAAYVDRAVASGVLVASRGGDEDRVVLNYDLVDWTVFLRLHLSPPASSDPLCRPKLQLLMSLRLAGWQSG